MAGLTLTGIPSEAVLNRRFQAWRPGAGNSYTGPVLTGDDLPTITLGASADGAYNQPYSVEQASGVVSAYGRKAVFAGLWAARTSIVGTGTVATYRFMCDGDKFSILTYAGGFAMDVYVNGKPFPTNYVLPAATTGLTPYGYQNFVFPTAKPRLIEMRMVGGFASLYTQQPYRIWKPPPDPRPRIAVVGDSYVAPTVMKNTTADGETEAPYLRGAYQRMPMLLGTPSLVTDGIGGTGYLAGGGASRPYTHADRVAWLLEMNPDVAVIHGGGANDLYNSFSVPAIVDAATGYFKTLRAGLPSTKLVFVEGFTLPLAGYAGNTANYILIRQQLQAALAEVGVYYLDVATTRPLIQGTGYVTAPVGGNNSNIYIGSDAAHLTVRGNEYVRHQIAPKISKVLADDGALLNSLL